ncbi:MAG: 2-oxo acid dehydrogenase subunit E2 [Phycisphaerales bacterium]|nr:2-oxo acid dehydrogenase subunit E2 [Phycisphaerales bacterium]MCI0631723.1 2-oxo acid dehydrogenase subunit E2 [Phycisphaerales bacterium]MCI0674796.1 2-oxo acid dehydrogenase subunit E2 [Phycisphaerales bacterium]
MPIPITMPRLSDTMEAGTIIKWNVKEGDKVSAGDVIADVETDKATMEMAVYDDGTVAKLMVPEGKSVGIGTTIAVLAGEGEDVNQAAAAAAAGNGEAMSKAKTKPRDTARVEPARTGGTEPTVRAAPKLAEVEAAQPKAAAPESGPREAERAGDGRLRISPVARRVADEHDIDLRSIEGTGPGGRIIKRDVLKAVDAAKETSAAVAPSARESKPKVAPVSQPAPKPAALATRVTAAAPHQLAPSLQEQIVPLSGVRQTIAKRLVEAKATIPHYQVTVAFNMDALLDLRATLNEQLQSQGVKLSVNDFLVRCCALAMYQHPEFNSSWGGDHIKIHGEINIGFAISLPRERGGGLVVGVLRNADQKSLRVISYESKALAEKARTRGLTIEEMSNSTFTISNLGMYGIDNFTAIINPPNSAILAVGAAIEKPVVRDHQLTVGHEMAATLSCDHRIIDGAMAAEYLNTLKQLIENPGTLLV